MASSRDTTILTPGSSRKRSGLASTGLLLELVDLLRRLGLGEIGLDRLARLGGQGVQVGLLRSGHRLVAGGPLLRILDPVGAVRLGLLACHLCLLRRGAGAAGASKTF